MSKTVDEWVTLVKLSSVSDASLIRSVLDSESIPSVLQGEQAIGLLGNVQAFQQLRLLVPKVDEERAQQILESMEEARTNPDEVHYLCDVDQASQELKDLDSLVIDLEAMTLCTVGAGTRRSTVESQLGEPDALEKGDYTELRFHDLGAIFYFDEDDRVDGFLAVIGPHPEYPDLEEYPGFWDPGSKLTPPNYNDFNKRFGGPRSHRTERGIWTYEWETPAGVFCAELDDHGKLLTIAIDFD